MLYTPPSGSTDPNASYSGKDVAAGRQGSKVPPGALENPQRELMAIIAAAQGAGLASGTNADLAQVLKAVRSGLLGRFPATGTPDTIAITPQPVYVALVEGMRFRFKVPGTNASNTSTTPTFAVNGITPVTIVKRNGSAPAVGDIKAGAVLEGEIFADGLLHVMSALDSDANVARLGAPYLGFRGDPASYAYPSGVNRVPGYAATKINLPGTTYANGILTIGATGRYRVTAQLNTLMPDTSGSYGYSLSVSKVNGSGTPLISVANLPVLVTASSAQGGQSGSCTSVVPLAAGDLISAFLQHNLASAVTQLVSLDIEWAGTLN